MKTRYDDIAATIVILTCGIAVLSAALATLIGSV
jgi:hypothetical protein